MVRESNQRGHMRDLTEKQENFLNFLKKEIERTGRTPSLRRAASDLGISHSAVVQYLKTLEEKGYVKREGRYSRTIHILGRDREPSGMHRWREIPIIGRIAAGLPMYAQQEWDGAIVVDKSVYRAPNLFALRIRGDSMIEAGILDGDIVICEPRQFARNGEIVAALIDGEEATVKRFYLREDHVELRPENKEYRPQKYDFSEILIQGKVIGLSRGPKDMEDI